MLESCLASVTGIAEGQHEDAGADLETARARGDAGQNGKGINNRKIRFDAEQNMVPNPDRIVTELLDLDAIVDERLCVRHFWIGGEVPRGDRQKSWRDSSSVFSPERLPQAVNRRSGIERRNASSSRFVGGSVIERTLVEKQLKAGVILDLRAVYAGVEGEHLHSTRFVVETKHR